MVDGRLCFALLHNCLPLPSNTNAPYLLIDAPFCSNVAPFYPNDAPFYPNDSPFWCNAGPFYLIAEPFYCKRPPKRFNDAPLKWGGVLPKWVPPLNRWGKDVYFSKPFRKHLIYLFFGYWLGKKIIHTYLKAQFSFFAHGGSCKRNNDR